MIDKAILMLRKIKNHYEEKLKSEEGIVAHAGKMQGYERKESKNTTNS